MQPFQARTVKVGEGEITSSQQGNRILNSHCTPYHP
jgi:hypothetical protein